MNDNGEVEGERGVQRTMNDNGEVEGRAWSPAYNERQWGSGGEIVESSGQ